MAPETSENWKPETVLAELRRQAQATGTAAAQVFLTDAGTEADLADTVRRAVDEAAQAAGTASKPSIGRISPLAKSFSLTAEPEVFAALVRHPGIKSILPSVVPDIYPKPVKVVRSGAREGTKP
jgi:hypothetical protein